VHQSHSASEFANAVVSAGVRLGTPATVLCDGDPGLWKLQRQVMPEATLVLDWFHIAMRFEHALQAARGLGVGTFSDYLRVHPLSELESAKWRLWHGRSSACLGRLARLTHWFDAVHVRDVKGPAAVQRHINDLMEYLYANELALVNYGRRRRDRLPISTAFVESAVNEILSKRMIKKQQMRWNRWTVQPFSTCVSPFSTRRSPARSGGSIQTSNQTTKTIPRGCQPDKPHDFACTLGFRRQTSIAPRLAGKQLRCIASAVARGDIVGRTRNHARGVGGQEHHHRRDIFGLDPGHAERRLGGENLSGLFRVRC